MKRKKYIFAGGLVLAAATGFFLLFHGNLWHTSAKRLQDKYEGEITPFVSETDKDKDGIDDQTDMLEGALRYVRTRPKYKSQYYETGYPDDGCGVCTDVVANACLSSGYDLMKLVQEDIAAHPDEYGIEEPDANIDFRRVKNLKVFFRNNAVELTTNIYDIGQWQGGDIVIFEGHIGMVSDRRNKNGVAYVIHHNAPTQVRYEEDILEKRDDLVAHYRISE